MFCDVLYLIKQKYPHIKGMKDIASATLIFLCTSHFHHLVQGNGQSGPFLKIPILVVLIITKNELFTQRDSSTFIGMPFGICNVPATSDNDFSVHFWFIQH